MGRNVKRIGRFATVTNAIDSEEVLAGDFIG